MKNPVTKFIKSFSRFNETQSTPANTLLSKNVTSNLTGYLVNLSQFQDMDDQEVYENAYAWTPEVGGAIDRKSSLVRQSIGDFYIKDVGEELDQREIDMLKDARIIAEEIKLKDQFESIAELLDLHGNVFIVPKKDTFTILPNKYCTLLDKKEVMGGFTTRIMAEPNFLVFNEQAKSEFEQVVYSKDKFIHIKSKETPIFATDQLNRKTYGLYAVSPTNRAMLNVWWGRQIQIIDILLRWKNIPRETYTIDTTMFSGSLYTGTPEERLTKSKVAFESYAGSLADELKNRTPDQGIVIPDSIKVGILESDVEYIAANELLNQLNSGITASLNMPRSVVDGTDSGSYASQLVISNYVASKCIQTAEKIKPVLLNIIKNRLLAISKSYPVEQLDIKIALELATTELEVWRQASVMASLGVYTESEIRAKSGYAPLLYDQRQFLVIPHNKRTFGDTVRDVNNGGGATANADYPVSETSRETAMYDNIDNMIDNEVEKV